MQYMVAYEYDKCVYSSRSVGNMDVLPSKVIMSIYVQCFHHKGLRQEQLYLMKTLVVEMY